jgi:hypothetical protein
VAGRKDDRYANTMVLAQTCAIVSHCVQVGRRLTVLVTTKTIDQAEMIEKLTVLDLRMVADQISVGLILYLRRM